MFTGLIEEIGKIQEIKPKTNGIEIKVSAQKVLEDSQIGDSIAINGVCLTITELGDNYFKFDVSQETLDRSTFKYLKIGDYVNLERALRPSDRLGGHIVQGHVDTVGEIKSIITKGEHTEFVFTFPSKYSNLIVEKGSIAIDGISLTINYIQDNSFSINIIPHTIQNTNLQFKNIGDKVNIEFDILGKYVNKILGKTTENNLEKLLENF